MKTKTLQKSNGGSAFLDFFTFIGDLNLYNKYLINNRNYLVECAKIDKFIAKVNEDEFLIVYNDLPHTAGFGIMKDGEIICKHIIIG